LKDYRLADRAPFFSADGTTLVAFPRLLRDQSYQSFEPAVVVASLTDGSILCRFWVDPVSPLLAPDGRRLAFKELPEPHPGLTPDTYRVVTLPSCGTVSSVRIGEHRSLDALAAQDRLVESLWERPTSRTLTVLDARNGRPIAALAGSQADVRSLSFDSEGKKVVAGTEQGKVRIFAADSGRLLAEVDPGRGLPVRALAVSPSGVVAAGDEGGTITFWDLKRLVRLATLRPVPGFEAALVEARSDQVELLGDPNAAERDVVCRVGAWTIPWAACRDRFDIPGIAAQALRGEVADATGSPSSARRAGRRAFP
jgi:WD40 repeat protein